RHRLAPLPHRQHAQQQHAAALQQSLADIQSKADYIAYSSAMGQLMAELGVADPADPRISALGTLGVTVGALENGKAQLAAAQTTLNAKRQDVSAMQEQAKEQITMGYAQIQYGRNDLEEGRAEYKKGERELLDAKKKLEDGKEEYATEKAKAEKKLADARIEIDDAQAKLDDLESPEWYVLTRDENMSVASFKSNTEKVEAIAKIFPVFFFLVAALVALTTMTRMVEEERLQIGTLKALGYSKGTIMVKYLFYALVASVLGSITGLAIGFKLFPTVIWNAYTMMYTLPKLYCPWNLHYALISSGAAIICTLLATLNACWSTLKEKPAALMLPKAPRAGKRILLERITFIWKRMKFTYKVTARNLFRYKKRLLMTVVGIAGCTALLVTGFGLHDSISDIVNKQFGEIFTYDASISLKNEDILHSEQLKNVIDDKTLVADYLAVHQEKCSNDFNGQSFSTYIFVPEDFEKLPNFLTLQHRLTGDTVPWNEDSVVITEKMSTRTGLSVGDEMILENKDDKPGRFTITGVAENYIENYVYMSKKTYEKGFSETLEPTTLVLKNASSSQENSDKLATAILEVEDISGISFVSTLKERFTNMMSKIDIIVVVLIVSAGALAFIVLYNLTNINITERVKEIATIKVLGFTDKEVNSYVYRESIVLALIGTLCGLVFGIFLHLFVILNIEVDMVMFGHTIKPLSYVYSAVLTMVFSMLVNVFMRRKLRNISMVESMKSPE
ncbi:MAG: FtsX-like permease family protein, partial [Oscillospiraceae bacterium]